MFLNCPFLQSSTSPKDLGALALGRGVLGTSMICIWTILPPMICFWFGNDLDCNGLRILSASHLIYLLLLTTKVVAVHYVGKLLVFGPEHCKMSRQ